MLNLAFRSTVLVELDCLVNFYGVAFFAESKAGGAVPDRPRIFRCAPERWHRRFVTVHIHATTIFKCSHQCSLV